MGPGERNDGNGHDHAVGIAEGEGQAEHGDYLDSLGGEELHEVQSIRMQKFSGSAVSGGRFNWRKGAPGEEQLRGARGAARGPKLEIEGGIRGIGGSAERRQEGSVASAADGEVAGDDEPGGRWSKQHDR